MCPDIHGALHCLQLRTCCRRETRGERVLWEKRIADARECRRRGVRGGVLVLVLAVGFCWRIRGNSDLVVFDDLVCDLATV